VKHFECPLNDWSEDVEDDATGYSDLLQHELDMHSGVARPTIRP
jgi:hypothetical protein